MSKSLPKDSESHIIDAAGLIKQFGRTRALDALDLRVAEGEVHGFLGSNGAGKSTTIRAILGQLRLDAGRLRVFGRDPRRDAVAIHADLAYVPGDTVLWPGLSGGECIDLLGRFSGRQDRRRRDELIEAFEFDPTKRARSYSKGNRQKVALIAALATRARLLLLDEPTSGLDPVMEAVFVEEVRRARAEGATVLLSSHILDEVEALCDRVTIIRNGRAVSSGSLADLRSHTRSTIEVTTAGPVVLATDADQVSVRREPAGLRTVFTVLPEGLPAALEAVAAAAPSQVVVRPPSLDELFLEHYSDDVAEPATVSS
ncbi:ABC transporter ATP-binding protein [Ammonicoccus fulvus]|uniref:ABC transporter ATP-binding protein n=1 Tax=Ammonicoccus fulvus TaxID=3138240 RepID=A0ABZ3FSS0_9ACTN